MFTYNFGLVLASADSRDDEPNNSVQRQFIRNINTGKFISKR